MRLFAIIGGILVAVLMAALVAPSFIDWGEYRERFENEISARTGLPVSVGGDVSVRLLPHPSLRFEDVIVGEADNPLLTVAQLRLDAELAPFLSGEFHVFDMVVTEPVLRIEFDDKGSPVFARSGTDQDGALSFIRQLQLDRAVVTGGEIIIGETGRAGSLVRLSAIDGALSMDSLSGPGRFDGALTIDGVQARVEMTTGILRPEGFSLNMRALWPERGLVVQTQGRLEEAASDAPWHYDGVFQLRPDDVHGAVFFVEGVFNAADNAISVDQYRASIGGGDVPYTIEGGFELSDVFGATRYDLTARGVQVNLDSAVADSGDGRIEDLFALARSVLHRLDLPAVPGTVRVDLPAIVSGETVLRDISVLARPDLSAPSGSPAWRIERVEAELPGRTRLEASGTVTASASQTATFSGRVVLASRQPSGLAAWMGLPNTADIRALAAAGLEGDVAIEGNRISLNDAVFILGNERLNGRGSLTLAQPMKPSMQLALEADGSVKTLADLLIGLSATGTLDGSPVDLDLSLTATDATYASLKADKLDAAFRLRQGTLTVDRFLLSGLFGADLSAVATLRSETVSGRHDVDISLVSPDARPFLLGVGETMLSTFPDFVGRRLSLVSEVLAGIEASDANAWADTELTLRATGRSMSDFDIRASGVLGGSDIIADFGHADLGTSMLSLQVANPVSDVLLDQLGLSALSASPEQVGPGELTLLMQTSAAPEATGAIDLRARFDDMMLQSTGTLRSQDRLADTAYSFDGSIVVEGQSMEGLLARFGIVDVGSQARSEYSLTMAMTVDEDGAAAFNDVSGTVGGADVLAALTLDQLPSPTSVSGSIQTSSFFMGPLVDVFVETADDTAQGMRFGTPKPGVPTLEIVLDSDRLTGVPGIGALDDVQMAILVDGGRAVLRDVQAGFGETRLALSQVSLQNAAGEVSVSAQGVVESLPLAEVADVGSLASGLADLSFTVAGSGRTGQALMGDLAGSGTINLSEIGVRGVYPEGFDDFIAAADSIGFGISETAIIELVDSHLLVGETRFGSLSAPVVITDGALRIPNVVMQGVNNTVTVTGDFGVSLVGEPSEVSATIRFDPGTFAIEGLVPQIGIDRRDGRLSTEMSAISAFVVQRSIEREQQRIAALQQRIAQRQILRRLAGQIRAERSAILAEEDEQRRLEEERRQAEERRRQEAAKQAEEAALQAELERQRAADIEARAAREPQPQQVPAVDPFQQEVEILRRRQGLSETVPGTGGLFDDLQFDSR